MNVEHRVFQKLFKEEKTELATQKVELNLVKNVESGSEKASSLYEQGIKKMFSAIGDIQSAIQTLNKSKDIADKALKEGKELEKLADKIGADLKSSTTAAIQNAYNLGGDTETAIKGLKKAKAAMV